MDAFILMLLLPL